MRVAQARFFDFPLEIVNTHPGKGLCQILNFILEVNGFALILAFAPLSINFSTTMTPKNSSFKGQIA